MQEQKSFFLSGHAIPEHILVKNAGGRRFASVVVFQTDRVALRAPV
jgi:hypothetical protein